MDDSTDDSTIVWELAKIGHKIDSVNASVKQDQDRYVSRIINSIDYVQDSATTWLNNATLYNTSMQLIMTVLLALILWRVW